MADDYGHFPLVARYCGRRKYGTRWSVYAFCHTFFTAFRHGLHDGGSSTVRIPAAVWCSATPQRAHRTPHALRSQGFDGSPVSGTAPLTRRPDQAHAVSSGSNRPSGRCRRSDHSSGAPMTPFSR